MTSHNGHQLKPLNQRKSAGFLAKRERHMASKGTWRQEFSVEQAKLRGVALQTYANQVRMAQRLKALIYVTGGLIVIALGMLGRIAGVW